MRSLAVSGERATTSANDGGGGGSGVRTPGDDPLRLARSTSVTGGDARGMPSLHSLVLRRAPLTDVMGTATSSVTAVNPPAKLASNQRKLDKAKLGSGIRLPLIRKEASVVSLSLTERAAAVPDRGKEADAPLLRPESSASLEARSAGSWMSLGGGGPGALRKCETAVGLSTSALEGRPINRSRVCSRCSSLLSLASSSRYSLAAGNFVLAGSQQTIGRIFCKLCLVDASLSKAFKIEGCGCSYCKDVSRIFPLE